MRHLGEAIKELHALGSKLFTLIGDNRRTANAEFQHFVLDMVEADIEPAGIAAYVKIGPLRIFGLYNLVTVHGESIGSNRVAQDSKLLRLRKR